MTLYSTDFEEYSTGVNLSDWSDIWSDASATFQAVLTSGVTAPDVDDPVGTKCCAYDKATDSLNAITWDDVGSVADVEILAKVRWKFGYTSTQGVRFFARVSGTSGNETCYCLHLTSTVFKIEKYVGGTPTTIATCNANLYRAFNSIFRFSVVGTTLKAKVWESQNVEPADWFLEVTDSDIASGAVGFGGYDLDIDYHVDYFTVDTTGATVENPVEPSFFGTSDITTAPLEELNAVRYLGGYNTLGAQYVTGAFIYCHSHHAEDARLALYAGGAADDPSGATLLVDFGIVPLGINGDMIINLDIDDYVELPADTFIWVGFKSNNGSFGFQTLTDTDPANCGSFQFDRGAYVDSTTSKDPDVAWPSTIPSGGTFGSQFTHVGLLIEGGTPPMVLPVLTLEATGVFQGGSMEATLPDLRITASSFEYHLWVDPRDGYSPVLPNLKIEAGMGIRASLDKNLPVLSLEAYAGACAEAVLPVLGLDAVCLPGSVGSLDEVLPTLSLEARTGAILDGKLPAMSLDAGMTGYDEIHGSLVRNLPGLVIEASALGQGFLSLDKVLTFPVLTISVSHGISGSLDEYLPPLMVEATGLPGGIGNVVGILPDLRISAGSLGCYGSLDAILPAIVMQTYASGDDYGGTISVMADDSRFDDFLLRHKRWR